MTKRWSESQNLLAQWFRERGWPYAEPTGSGRPGVDLTGMPGLAPEVKARLDAGRLLESMRQARTRAGVAFVIQRPRNFGPANIDLWPVTITLGEFTALLQAAGYGDARPPGVVEIIAPDGGHADGCLLKQVAHAACLVPTQGAV